MPAPLDARPAQLVGGRRSNSVNSRMRIGLFVTCLGDTLFPEAPRATVAVLERLGHEVVFPREQTRCGQLHQHSGYPDVAHTLAQRVARIFDGFEAVGLPSASCLGAARE